MSWHTSTFHQFSAEVLGDRYLLGRWGYYSAAIDMIARARDLDRDRLAIEIGPRTFPVLRGDPVLYVDNRDWGLPGTLFYDVDRLPWSFIPDRAARAAVVVALQVLEHLENPAGVLREMLRIADSAIVSIPNRWTAGPPGHRGLDLDTVRDWAGGAGDIVRTEIVGSRLITALVPTRTEDLSI